MLNVNLEYGWRLEGSLQDEIGDRFYKGIFSNGRTRVRYLDVYRCGALGEYLQIWEIRANTLEF